MLPISIFKVSPHSTKQPRTRWRIRRSSKGILNSTGTIRFVSDRGYLNLEYNVHLNNSKDKTKKQSWYATCHGTPSLVENWSPETNTGTHTVCFIPLIQAPYSDSVISLEQAETSCPFSHSTGQFTPMFINIIDKLGASVALCACQLLSLSLIGKCVFVFSNISLVWYRVLWIYSIPHVRRLRPQVL